MKPVPDDFGPFCRTHPNLALLLISVAGLFIELMLIRWIGTEVRIFAYLQNTVLAVCFLGIGVGCFTCQRPISLARVLWPLLVLVALIAIPPVRALLHEISQKLSVLDDLVIWEKGITQGAGQTAGALALGLGSTLLLMLLVLELFIPIGRVLGRLMAGHPRPIRAYSINVAGSLLGIWAFVLASAAYLPPAAWIGATGLFLLPFVWDSRRRWINAGLLAASVLLSVPGGFEDQTLAMRWSPYQKLVLYDDARGLGPPGDLLLSVNNAAYQRIMNLRDPAIPRRNPPIQRGYSQYDLPARLHANARSMLIVGAGTGNDAAGALRNGVERIVAVEIDPAILSLGRRFHPEQPYDSPRVHAVNDDARSYFATADEKFDVISFGLLDSHTTTSMTNARLDHYVYTAESLQAAKRLLAPGGIAVLSFEVRYDFIGDRIARMLREVFGEAPLCFRVPPSDFGWGGVMFVAGDQGVVRRALAADPPLRQLVDLWQSRFPVSFANTTAGISDDWPYLYLKDRRIPLLYFLLAGLLLLLVLRCQRELQLRQLVAAWGASHWHFFFLGAAFLLLEVQNISKAAVVLGSTWQVNAVIISGVLVMILLANAITARFPRLPLAPVFVLLVGSCAALYVVDLARFAFLPYATKAVVVGGLTTLPMLFSGIVFIRSFAAAPHKDEALGANMIGALVGGLLQSLTFIIGIKALLLVVAALYVLAMFIRPTAANTPVSHAAEVVPPRGAKRGRSSPKPS